MTTLELTVSRFVEHKRAVGRKYESEEADAAAPCALRRGARRQPARGAHASAAG